MQNIVVYGAGGHAKAVIDIIEKAGFYRIIGLLDANKCPGTSVYGYEVLGDDAWLASNQTSIIGGIIAVGDNWVRSQIAARIFSVYPGFAFINAIHPLSSIARGASIGVGSVIMSGAVINSDARIGDHCVFYPNSSLDHDSTLGSFVTLAPNTATGGNVHIGQYSVISIGANIIHGRIIGEHTVIGAGSTVLTDIASNSIAYGTPARVVRTREVGERYL